MVQCKKCKLFVSVTKDDVIKCKGPCEGVFHKKCIQNIKAFVRNEVCDTCSKNESSPKTVPPKITIDLQKATVETMLAELNNKLAIIYETQKKIEELTETVDFYAEQFQKITEFKDTMQKKITSLENTNIFLKKTNEALEERITYLEQKQTENNVEIVGVEETKNENTAELVQNIAYKLKVNPEYIVETKRVGREMAGEKRGRPIVVALRSKSARDDWIRQRKIIVNNNDILHNKNEKRIYINENLTKTMRQLFWITKNTLKDKYKYIWIQNQRILIKRDDTAKIRNIRSEVDVQKLCHEDAET